MQVGVETRSTSFPARDDNVRQLNLLIVAAIVVDGHNRECWTPVLGVRKLRLLAARLGRRRRLAARRLAALVQQSGGRAMSIEPVEQLGQWRRRDGHHLAKPVLRAALDGGRLRHGVAIGGPGAVGHHPTRVTILVSMSKSVTIHVQALEAVRQRPIHVTIAIPVRMRSMSTMVVMMAMAIGQALVRLVLPIDCLSRELDVRETIRA